MASSSRGLQPWLRPWAERLLRVLAPYGVKLTSTYRSRSAQLALWNNRANNPYPVAPPGTSMHEKGRAFDIVGPPEVLWAAGMLWRQWGGQWSPSDEIHFQA